MRKQKRGETASRPKRQFPNPSPATPLPEPAAAPTAPVKLLTAKEVMAKCGVKSWVTIWSWIKQGHFPPGRVIGSGNGRRSTLRWIESEVDLALVNMPRRFPKGRKA
jgi:predicted DNA-binding transcriptional regulator AlpA